MYSSLERFTEGPHVDVVIRCIAVSIAFLLLTVFLIYLIQLSFEFTHIPRTFIAGYAFCGELRMAGMSLTNVFSMRIVDAKSVLSCLWFRVKWMS
jgi:hypothetical protein